MKKIAESYSTEIFEMLAENAALKSSNAELEVDNEKLRQEKVEILEILGEAKEIIAMVEVFPYELITQKYVYYLDCSDCLILLI